MIAARRFAKVLQRGLVPSVALVAALSFLSACGGKAPEAEPAAKETAPAPAPAPAPAAQAASASNQPCPNPPKCGTGCSNTPYEPTDCWTTSYGPAAADVVIGNRATSTNMLYCSAGTYALCFFSGPPTKGLPCLVDGDVAHCTCQVYSSGGYFVDINGILNLGAYNQTVYGSSNPTVKACGADGSGCANISTCGFDGKKSTCGSLPQAPVCQYVQNENGASPQSSLIPGADLISTFSLAMQKEYTIGLKSETCPSAPYAGCMTAPCRYPPGTTGTPKDGSTVRCDCPIVTGPYQVGEEGQSCTIPSDANGSYVWSAAYTPPS
ncbi:MAG: hypothetical protein ABJC13_09345 [Acidobacteriota bacterium]